MSFRIPRRDAELRFVTKFGENWLLRSYRKVAWITAPWESSQPPFCPKTADRAQNSLNVVTPDMSMYTEFGPDRLRFAGLIPERLIFGPKSHSL